MNKQNPNDNNNLIENLNTSEEIKDVLRKINSVASSSNSKVKQSVKDLFIISPSCKELSKIAKCYERIIVTNGVYPTRGTRTYLELAFPSSGKERDYKEFFASPQLAAATQNYFTGVFLISFEQWTSANDLVKDSAFKDLTQYIDSNKERISFVFHVTPEFRDSNHLQKELSKHLNVCLLKHSLPDMDSTIQYVEKQLSEAGIKLDSSGKREIIKLLEEKIDVTSKSFQGYRTLEKFVSNLWFELYAITAGKNGDPNSSYCIGGEEIKVIASAIDIPDENDSYQIKLGFH